MTLLAQIRNQKSMLSPSLWNYASIHCIHSHTGTTEIIHADALYQPFQLTAEQAKEKFLKWQRKGNLFSPSNLLSPGSYHIKPVMLPYWIFTAEASIKYTAHITPDTNASKSTHETYTGWKTLPYSRLFLETQPEMQVYASFEYRQDFGNIMKSEMDISALKKLSKEEVRDMNISIHPKNNEKIPIDPPPMRRSLAWSFALQRAHDAELDSLPTELAEEYKTPHIRVANIAMSVHQRACRLVYLPVYHIRYAYGEGFNAHGERYPQTFHGLVSGIGGGLVAGQQHISVKKTAVTGGICGVAYVWLLSGLASIVQGAPWVVSGYEAFFSALISSSFSVLVAQMLPARHARRAEHKLVEREAELLDAAAKQQEEHRMHVQNGGIGESSYGSFQYLSENPHVSEYHEQARRKMEWLRWEESDKQSWDPDKRQKWALHLFQLHHHRRKELNRAHENARRERQRLQAEEHRERRRQARWDAEGYTSSRMKFGNIFSGGLRAGGHLDYLGYYKALGLDAWTESGKGVGDHPDDHRRHRQYNHHIPHWNGYRATQEDIKRAFRAAAMEWHPDKHVGVLEKKIAREKFQTIRAAYETLKDPEKRKKYDLGQL